MCEEGGTSRGAWQPVKKERAGKRRRRLMDEGVRRSGEGRTNLQGREGSGTGRWRDLLSADHWLPCHPYVTKKIPFGFFCIPSHSSRSLCLSLFPFFFFQMLFSFSTWQRSLKLLSFPNRELFPDSLPLSYNYSAGPCFSVLFSGSSFPALPVPYPGGGGGDITASVGQGGRVAPQVRGQGCSPPVHTCASKLFARTLR